MELKIQAKFPDKLKHLFKPSRYKVIYGGRGGGRSWGVARTLLIKGTQSPIRVLCTREIQKSIRESVHQLLQDQISNLGLDHFYDVLATEIRAANGGKFSFAGLNNQTSDSLKSYEGYDYVWVEEAQNVTDRSWRTLTPTIRKDESEIWITFNPELEDDPTYVRFVEHPPDDCIIINLNYRDNPFFPSVLERERLDLLRLIKEGKRQQSEYDHVWEGKCLRWLEGAIYAEELRQLYDDNRVRLVPHQEGHPVFTAWDLGRTDDTAIWWYQVIGGEVHIIDCYYSTMGSVSSYASQILGREVAIDLVEKRYGTPVKRQDGGYVEQTATEIIVKMGLPIPEIAYRANFKYKKHWLPHDAKAKTLAAKGRSTIEQLAKVVGSKMVGICPELSVLDGISATRTVFRRFYFDQEKCSDGLRYLRKYRREKQKDDRSFRANPVHDDASHLADALRTLALCWQYTPRPMEVTREVIVPLQPTLNDMWDFNDRMVNEERRI